VCGITVETEIDAHRQAVRHVDRARHAGRVVVGDRQAGRGREGLDRLPPPAGLITSVHRSWRRRPLDAADRQRVRARSSRPPSCVTVSVDDEPTATGFGEKR
jgi:hypothetical protein